MIALVCKFWNSFWCAKIVLLLRVKVVKKFVSKYLNLSEIAGRIVKEVGLVYNLYIVNS